MMSRVDAYTAIDSERDYQLEKWGDKPHEVGGWLLLMEEHLARARAAWAGANNDVEALKSVRKVAAVAVACMEQHGAPVR